MVTVKIFGYSGCCPYSLVERRDGLDAAEGRKDMGVSSDAPTSTLMDQGGVLYTVEDTGQAIIDRYNIAGRQL